MRSLLLTLAVLAHGLVAGCSDEPEAVAPPVTAPSATVSWVGPSGLEVESEQAARAAIEAQRAETERLAAEAAARAEADRAAAAQAEADRAAADRAAEEAAAQAVIEAEGGCPPGWYFDDTLGCTEDGGAGHGDDGYVASDSEVRCSAGTATVEGCFGPGADLNGNGIADVTE